MTNSQRLATVRAHLRRWLIENLSPSRSESDDGQEPVAARPAEGASVLSESILIRDGFYAGRTFELDLAGTPMRAVWFMEPDEVKIRDQQGNLVAVFQGDEIIGTTPAVEVDVPADSRSAEASPLRLAVPPAEETVVEERPAEESPAAKSPAAKSPAEDSPEEHSAGETAARADEHADKDSGDDQLPKAA